MRRPAIARTFGAVCDCADLVAHITPPDIDAMFEGEPRRTLPGGAATLDEAAIRRASGRSSRTAKLVADLENALMVGAMALCCSPNRYRLAKLTIIRGGWMQQPWHVDAFFLFTLLLYLFDSSPGTLVRRDDDQPLLSYEEALAKLRQEEGDPDWMWPETWTYEFARAMLPFLASALRSPDELAASMVTIAPRPPHGTLAMLRGGIPHGAPAREPRACVVFAAMEVRVSLHCGAGRVIDHAGTDVPPATQILMHPLDGFFPSQSLVGLCVRTEDRMVRAPLLV